jgi:hypothetical protein
MNSDFRSSPSNSSEGQGVARRAWDTYVARVEPALRPAGEALARNWTMDMMGFYMAWHLYGGFEGLQEALGCLRRRSWRKVAKFRRILGVHPDEATFAGVTIDREAFWASSIAEADLSEDPES